jgi:hypothetical protein
MDITEGKLKEILDEQRDSFKRHVDAQTVEQSKAFQRTVEKEHQETRHLFGVMKEDFDSKIERIGEQYGAIKEMVGALAEDMQIVKSDIEFFTTNSRRLKNGARCLKRRRENDGA